MRRTPFRPVAATLLATAALIATGSVADPAAAATYRCKSVRVTGQTVAVRYDPDPRARIVRYVRRGDVLRSCFTHLGRAESSGDYYRACDKRGLDWYWVKGGTIPTTCARKIS
ncbi:hypothetical protein [Streptomyces sp. 7N604]|uniref:hypothetical protein n=1 Tax=Streptomyces sp. 7N604 TaxID=3457415 RepID=UPI003FD0A3AF